MPSPAEEHPGLLIRDPYKYSETVLIIPPVLVECLENFDGEHTDLDLRTDLLRVTKSRDVSDWEKQLVDTLSAAGVLEDDFFKQMQKERREQFAAAPPREPAHAGSAYPDEPAQLLE